MSDIAKRLLLAVLLALAPAACGRDEPVEEPPREPAPVTPEPAGALLDIDPSPRTAVGARSGDPMRMLDRVVTPFLLPGGSLVVPNAGSSSIRVFRRDGTFVRELGGPGEGPGEIGELAAAWARGDTIEAFDAALHRIVRFLPGDSVETIRIRPDTLLAASGLGPLGSGWALLRLQSRYGSRDRATVVAVSERGEVVGEIAERPGMARFQAPHVSGPHPLSPRAVFDVHDDLVYAAETLTPVIGVYDARGAHVRDVRIPLSAPDAPATVMEDVIGAAVARAPEEDQEMVRQRWSAYPDPESLSIFWSVIVDDLGYIWIRPYDPFVHALALEEVGAANLGGGEWVVLSPGGVEVARVRAPDGLAIEQITANAVVGIRRDELGVESVRVHELTRR